MGLLADRNNDSEAALKDYSQASQDPDLRKECLYRELVIFDEIGKTLEMQRCIKELAAMPPFSIDSLNLLSNKEKAEGHLEKAVKTYQMLHQKLEELSLNYGTSSPNRSIRSSITNQRKEQVQQVINELELKLK